MPLPLLPIIAGIGTAASIFSQTPAGKKFFGGSPGKVKNVPSLLPEQRPLYEQAVNAGLQPGAGGAFGEAADYYRNQMGETPGDYDRFAAPALRQYNQDIIPGISEQFAGMGAGGLSSSGFRNAQIQGATDLSERLGALRAQLRQNAAQGLTNIGQIGLQSFSQPMQTQQGSSGFFSNIAPAIGQAAGTYAGQRLFGTGKSGENVGQNTAPYQNTDIPASP